MFGQPFERGGSYAWTDGKYSVVTGETSPVMNIEVQSFTDVMEQHRICEGFLPTNSVFEKQVNNDYFFTSSLGEIELSVGDNYCVLQFTTT